MLRESADRGTEEFVVEAPAKVNLFLEVLGKRPDGFHELQTLMVAVGLVDRLTFRQGVSPAIRLTCPGSDLSPGPENLIVRAAEAVRRFAGVTSGAEIVLEKRIPIAAGLAGGSSDAAATLVGLNRLWRVELGPEDLWSLAAGLGSDVPFFLGPKCAWCTGRGEVIEPLELGVPLDLVLVAPPFGLSTAEVFRGVTVSAVPKVGDAIRTAVAKGEVAAIGAELHNRLEESALRLRPELADWLARLRALGLPGCLMSGSGSTVFALCRGPDEAGRVAREIETGLGPTAGARVFVVRSLDPGS